MNNTTNIKNEKKKYGVNIFSSFSRVLFAFARSADGWPVNAYEYLLSYCYLWDYSCIKREADVCSEFQRMTEKGEMREKGGAKN